MLLVIDNYDSFTYNLVQYLGELGADPIVRRNDELSMEGFEALKPTRMVVSPGPCTPNEAGLSCALIERFHKRIPILGVCLGHQCLGQVMGGRVVRAREVMHGKTSQIHHDGKTALYKGLENPFTATRYHSLVVDRDKLPAQLEVTAWTEDEGKTIMGLKHKDFPVYGVQFHPESILTDAGKKLLKNFLET